MTKLAYDQAVKLVEQASQESTEIQHYRFGQALWNLIPIDISSEYLSTNKDFFYWVDNTKVIDVFYQHFVEPLDTNSWSNKNV